MSKFLTAQDLYPLPDSLYPGSKGWTGWFARAVRRFRIDLFSH